LQIARPKAGLLHFNPGTRLSECSLNLVSSSECTKSAIA
jgi:hypothetical protein